MAELEKHTRGEVEGINTIIGRKKLVMGCTKPWICLRYAKHDFGSFFFFPYLSMPFLPLSSFTFPNLSES